MNVNRRMLAGAALLGASAYATAGNAQSQNQETDVLRRLGYLFPEDEVGGIARVGSGPLRSAHVATAFRLLWNCPRSNNVLEIAQYFEGLSTPIDGKVYNAEWPAPDANPLMAAFFGMTNIAPNDGDETAWCAAFMSFVLHAAGKKSKHTARALGYRDYGPARTPDNPPQPGDIAVFRWLNQSGQETGYGHVGFFISEADNVITLLGGNQSGATGTTGAVTRSTYRRYSTRLQLVACYAVEEAT